MEYGSTARDAGGRRRAAARPPRSHRAGTSGPGPGGPGRHRAAHRTPVPGLPERMGRLHLAVAGAIGLVLAAGAVIGAGLLRGEGPGAAPAAAEAALLYAGGEAVDDGFADRHAGLVDRIHAELEHRWDITPDRLFDAEANPGGVTVVLTIDQRLQESAEAAEPGAGIVAVEPGTGAVLCYNGAEAATGADQAGSANPHPPGSVFDMVTAATALEAGDGAESKWTDTDGEVTLAEAVRDSRRSALGAVVDAYGAPAVVNAAIALGVTAMAGDDGVLHDLTQGVDYSPFEGGDFGDYPVSVVDMAAAYATIAADGLRADTHLIARVVDARGNTLEPGRGVRTKQSIAPDTARALQALGLGIGEALAERDFFGLPGSSSEPAGAWFVGAIPQLSVAVWTGAADASEPSGVPVWRQVVETAIDVMEYDRQDWGSPPPEPTTQEPSTEPTSEEPSDEPSEDPSEETTSPEPPQETSTPPSDPTTSGEPSDDPPSEPTESPTDDCGWLWC